MSCPSFCFTKTTLLVVKAQLIKTISITRCQMCVANIKIMWANILIYGLKRVIL